MDHPWRDDRHSNSDPTAYTVAWRAVDRKVYENSFYQMQIAHVLDTDWSQKFMASISGGFNNHFATSDTFKSWQEAFEAGKKIIDKMILESGIN